jgi:hypothetical protein
MRRLALFFLTLLLLASPAFAKFEPWAGPKPVAVFTEFNPWLMVIGSDTPRVVVYENGDVIFAKKAGDTYAYHSVKLAPAELTALEARWQSVFAHTPPPNGYEMSYATDQATAAFYLRNGDKTFRTSIYGWSCRGRTPAPANLKPEERPPAALADLHKALCTLDYANSHEWVPKYVEVMLWDYSYAPNASIVWPNAWPGLDSPRALKRGDAWSIFLDGSKLPELRAFLAQQRDKGAVELGGKKWAADFRYTFPSEPMWRGGH